ncbi:MAG TPA: APC family permease, partial [Planctomycetaceae bacterium]|nr:APC family permease [Planctomycetaceae bacterium]
GMAPDELRSKSEPSWTPPIGVALVFVLYAFGGWNDSAFVAAEVESPKRNMPIALIAGIIGITVLYLITNLAYLAGLGLDGLRRADAPAADLAASVFGTSGKAIVSVLVMISALGAVNGMALTGSRVYARLGQDHNVFRWLAHWNESRGAPTRSLVAQAVVSSLMIVLVGSSAGRFALDQTVRCFGIDGVPWFDDAFETLVAGTAPIFWFFFLLTGIAFFVLRRRDGGTQRPFRVPLYPITPILFCAMCVYMLYASADYAKGLIAIGLVPLIAGPLIYWLAD